MAKPIENEEGINEIPDPVLSEIDLIVSDVDQKYVLQNLPLLLEAGASPQIILKKFHGDEIIKHLSFLTTNGISTDGIVERLKSSSSYHLVADHEKLAAVGIPFDLEWAMGDVRGRAEEGFVSPLLVNNLVLFLDNGADPDEVLEIMKKDKHNHYHGIIAQSAKTLISRGADLSIDEVSKQVRVGIAYGSRFVLENLVDLVELGAEIDLEHLVENYIAIKYNTYLVSNIDQVMKVCKNVDVTRIVQGVERMGVNWNVAQLLDYGADPKVVSDKLVISETSELLHFARMFHKRGLSIDLVVRQMGYLDRVLWSLDELMEMGASKTVMIGRMTSHGIVQYFNQLMRYGFDANDLAKRFSHEDKIKHYALLKRHGADIDLGIVVEKSIESIDEYWLESYPDAYDKLAKFLLKHRQTLIDAGVDISAVLSRNEFKDVDKHEGLSSEEKLTLKLEELRASRASEK